MSNSVYVDDTQRPVRVPLQILSELCEHAVASLPDECCGLIVGDDADRFQHPVRCRNEMSNLHRGDPRRFPRSGREAFWMHELDYEKAQREADESGRRITAVYHSHVGAGLYLSPMDVEYALHRHFPFPGAAHIVLSISGDGHVTGEGLFEWRGSDRGFVGRKIIAS